MKKILFIIFGLSSSTFAWSQAASGVGLSLGYLTHEEVMSVGGTLEYALDTSKSIGLYAAYLDADSPVDLALKSGIEGKYYIYDFLYAGLLGGLQYNRFSTAGKSTTDWYADIGIQAGMSFKVGELSFGPLYQLIYTVDFTEKGSSDKDYLTSHFGAFAKYNF